MPRRFDLDSGDVDWTLRRVHIYQASFTLAVGAIIAIVPQRRFGNSYRFIIDAPGGQYNVAAVFLAIGVFLCWALRTGHRHWMSRALFTSGTAYFFFGLSLGAGALFGPTGVLGAPFTFYVSGHMLIQSELLGPRGRPRWSRWWARRIDRRRE